MCAVPQPVKPSDQSSTRSVQRRNEYLRSQIDFVSGGAFAHQTISLIKSMGKDERAKILKSANLVTAHIDAEQMVAMKCNLGFSWEKLKVIAR